MRYSLSRMSKNGTWIKECAASLLTAVTCLGLTGCSLPDSLLTDSGSNVIMEVDSSQYLDFSALEKTEEENAGTWNGYEVYTLNYGTFATDISGLKATLNMIEISPVKAQFSSGTMYLLEVLVSKYSFVEKGDVIARVSMEISELDLEELELKLLRVEEDYAAYLADYEERHTEAVENISVYNHPGKIDRIEINQMELDHAQTVKNYEKQIENYKERITELKSLASTKEILAPSSGFVLEMGRLQVGQELENGTLICNVAPTDKMMLEFSDETFHYGYGMDLNLVVGNTRSKKTYQVEAVSAIGKTLSSSWHQTSTKITGDYTFDQLIGDGPYTVTGTTNVMRNVLLVPVKAVTESSEKYYVTVLNEDGTLEKRQFISGGKNSQYYWVFDGLEQGTKIIIED